MKEQIHFKVVEGDPEDYWEEYEKFIQLYNSNAMPVKDIAEKLGLSQAKYRNYRNQALEENRLQIDTRKRIFKNKYGKYSRPKHYSKQGNLFAVSKYLNGKVVHFGSYPDENIAQKIVEKLIQCRWDKKQLRRIQDEVLLQEGAAHG